MIPNVLPQLKPSTFPVAFRFNNPGYFFRSWIEFFILASVGFAVGTLQLKRLINRRL